jgi:predicted glycosyltransferase
MRLLIDMGHPAHVHLFKNFIWEMEKRGHIIKVTARDKDVTKQLLNAYNIPFELVGRIGSTKLGLAKEWLIRDAKILNIGRKYKPDILLGVLNPAVAHCAKILGKPSIIFTDSEPEAIKYPIADMITTPFAASILTLSTVRHDYGNREVRIDSLKELAYLHPKYFSSNPEVIESLGISPGDYVLLRFISWGA